MDSREILESIFDFCKIRNSGNALQNGKSLTPRIYFILDLLDRCGIDSEVDSFKSGKPENLFHNIILRGSSKYMIMAHHDISNPRSENANDNSASIICAICIKYLFPEVNVVLTDGEEIGMPGSTRIADQIVDGEFVEIDWVINLELCGLGGDNFIVGKTGTPLQKRIAKLFSAPVIFTPPSDCYPLLNKKINTTVLNPMPFLEDGTPDNSNWSDCHSMEDTVDKISVDDMEKFVVNVLGRFLISEENKCQELIKKFKS
jgi:hypothetical protein